MRRLLVMLLAVILQLSFAQTSPIDLANSKENEGQIPIIQIEKERLQSKLLEKDRFESLKVNIPYISDEALDLHYHSLLSEDFIENYPEVRVYKWRNEYSTGTVTVSPEALYINKLDDCGMTMLYPKDEQSDNYYVSTSNDALLNDSHKHECEMDRSREAMDRIKYVAETAGARALITNGSTLRTYRMAPIVTGEYYQANGGSNATVVAHLTNGIAMMEAIFENDLAVNFTVLTPVLFSNPATDPFQPDETGGDPRTEQARDEVSAQFNSANYDLGHVFHNHQTDDGWSTGGVAFLGAVCVNNIKGGGWSGSFNNNGVGWIQLACHELGHMFGAQHTFNGEGDSCQDAISGNSAFEIGSGTTIMSYQGICGDGQNIPASGAADSYFHVHSLIEMISHMEVLGTCSNETSSGNNPPTIDPNPCNLSYQIPRGTPFIMSAEANDPDGDPLTFVWEQYDEDGQGTPTQGEIGNQASGNTVGPLFRSFPPSTDIARSFPDRATVINGNGTDPFQALPGTGRLLNFKLTARDNQSGGGAVAIEDRQVQVVTSGPFRVTNPNSNMTITAGDPLEVTWSTGGSDEVCNNVDIYLSIDGGFTTPFLLANNVDYASGAQTINIPSSLSQTDQARVLIICDDNPCVQIFDLSNNDFTISSNCRAFQSYVCQTDKVTADQGDQSLDLMMTSVNGEIVTGIVSNPISQSSDRMDMSTFNATGTACTEIFEFFYESEIITPTESGLYTINNDTDAGGGFGFFSIFEEDGFSTSNPCSSFVISNASNLQGSQVSASPVTTVMLDACKRYVIAFYNYGTLPQTNVISSITGPGEIILGDGEENLDYSYTYVAVNTNNDIISATSPTGDFTSLGGGIYNVFGVAYKSGGMTPPANTDPANWTGQALNALIFSGNCLLQSQNFRCIEIISTCSIDAVSTGGQTGCDPNTNEYTQDLIIEYDSAPNTGNLVVNGALYPLTGSPQGIILENLISDGLPVDVTVSFSEDTSCESIFPAVFTAPENCCPIVLELGDSQSACIDDMFTLDAGPDGATYEWSVDDVTLSENGQIITPIVSGLYKVTVTTASGCAKTDEVDLIINPNPEILLDANSSQCEGVLAILNPNVGNSSFTYNWTRDAVFVAGSEIIEVSIPGEYCLEVTDDTSGCTSTACTIVEFVDAPDVDLGMDLTGCVGEEFTLDAGDDGSSYRWFKDDVEIANEVMQALTVSESGVYIAIVSEGLCSTPDTIDVLFAENPTVDFEISASFTLCEGSSETTSINGFYDDYTLTLDGATVAMGNDPTYTIDAPGEYIIVATNLAGCEARDTTTAVGSMLPVVDLGEDKIGCIGSEVILNAGMDGSEYIWFLGTDILPVSDPVITVDVSGEYSVIVSNAVFCTTMDTVSVDFLPGPTLDIGDNFDLCEGESETITATTNGDNIKWFKDNLEIIGETDFTLEVTESGVYLAEVAGISGCAVEDQITVNVFDNPVVDIDATRTICEDEETTIIAGDATNTYVWTDQGGVVVSESPELNTGIAGTYTVVVTNSNTCTASDQVEIIVLNNPVITIDDTAVFCEGSSTILTADVIADSYSWSKEGIFIPGESTTSLEVDEPGEYTITAVNGLTCITSSDVITVTELPNPTFDLGTDTELCPGDNIMLTISEDGTYEWSTTETDQSITIEYDELLDTETLITAMLTTTDGCMASDEITITRLTNPTPIIEEEATLCVGDTLTLSVTASDGTPTDDYQWSGPEGTMSSMIGSSIDVFPDIDATYTVTVVNGCGVSNDMAATMIFIDQPLDLSAGRDTCVILGRSINLNATGGSTYEWNDNGTFVNGTSGARPEVMPLVDTQYFVNITNENGCTYRDSVSVCIIEDPFSLILPISLITPNDDGQNDVLEFRGLEAFPNNRLRIYSRWGSVIFDRDGYQKDNILFDGTRGGELLPPDTYYYILEIDDKIIFKQNLTIVRD